DAACPDIGHRGTQNADGINAEVTVEALVLHCDHSVQQGLRHFIVCDRQAILASLRVDLGNLDWFQPGQINLLIALNGAQAADLSATEIYLHVDTGFLAVPELEATGI